MNNAAAPHSSEIRKRLRGVATRHFVDYELLQGAANAIESLEWTLSEVLRALRRKGQSEVLYVPAWGGMGLWEAEVLEAAFPGIRFVHSSRERE